ncbi:hypothetical protein OPL82_002683, partial [Enterococcus faecalis]|nr:hypothetical protein [Enterococcus faecalis]
YDVGIWNRNGTFHYFLPYLLNQSDTTNLMIGETRGEIIFLSPYNYSNDFDVAEKVLRKAMKTITNTLELYDRTIEDKVTIDVDKVMGQRAILDQGRNWLNPNDSLSYELYRVSGYKDSHQNNGAMAGHGLIHMQAAKLSEECTIAHEFGHELNNLFNADNEYFTSYIFDQGRQKGAYLNIFSDEETVFNKDHVVTNKTTLQIQSKEDLVNYTKNMEDMVYILDGIIATKVLELPIEEQAKYIKIAYVDGINGVPLTQKENAEKVHVKDLTVEELRQLNIKTIDDLIDNDAVIMQPKDTNKNIFRYYGQGHGTSLTYASFFLVNGKAVQYNHRIINTLLAKDGWEGLKSYNLAINNAYANGLIDPNLGVDEGAGVASLLALQTVYNDDTLTYRDLVRERYTEAMDDFKENGLLGESYETVMKDFSSMELSEFYNYKYNMMTR